MVSFEEVSIAHLAIILHKVVEFEDLANIICVWKRGKNRAEIKSLLDKVCLIKYFPYGTENNQFLPFMFYAAHLGVHDALYFLPVYQLLHKNEPTITSLQMLHTLGAQGHEISRFTHNLFSIVYAVPGYTVCIDDMVDMMDHPSSVGYMNHWVNLIKTWYRSLWSSMALSNIKLPEICNNRYHLLNPKFYTTGFPTKVEWSRETACTHCKVYVVMHNFALWAY